MKKFFLISERIVRGIALCVVVFFLILGSIFSFYNMGWIYGLEIYLDNLFNRAGDYELFRLCFSYILIASIYRYARFRKFVWDDLFKWDEYTFAQWDNIGFWVFMAFSFLMIVLAISGVIPPESWILEMR